MFSFFFPCYIDLLHLHSFPTRRSSDLHYALRSVHCFCARNHRSQRRRVGRRVSRHEYRHREQLLPTRLEEHTSELQSRQYLVCRLLLEKKKTYNTKRAPSTTSGTAIPP